MVQAPEIFDFAEDTKPLTIADISTPRTNAMNVCMVRYSLT
jgi:hypothetical protein